MRYDTIVSTGFTSPNIAGMLFDRNVADARSTSIGPAALSSLDIDLRNRSRNRASGALPLGQVPLERQSRPLRNAGLNLRYLCSF